MKRLFGILVLLALATSAYAQNTALAQAAAGMTPGQLLLFHPYAGDNSNLNQTIFASLSHASNTSAMEFANKCAYDWTPRRVDRTYRVNGAKTAGSTSITVDTGIVPIVVGDRINFEGNGSTYTVTSNITSGGTFNFTPGLTHDVADNVIVQITRDGRRLFFFGHGHNASSLIDPKFSTYEFADDKWKVLPVFSTAATNDGGTIMPDIYYGLHHTYGAVAMDPARQHFYKGHVANTNPVMVNVYNTDEFDPTVIGGKKTIALVGTITVTNGSMTLTGSGTSFTTQLVSGSQIRLSNDLFAPWTQVQSVLSNTSATLSFNYTGTTCSGCAAKVLDYNGIKDDMRFEPAVNFSPSGGREHLEFFPERDSLLMINNNQIWEKRVNYGGASSWTLIHTPTTSVYGTTHYDTYNYIDNQPSVGDNIFAFYHPKLRAVLVGAATGAFGDYPPVLYLLKSDGTLQGPLDRNPKDIAPASGPNALVWADPVRNVFQMLVPDYDNLNNPYTFLELDPTKAPGTQWTTLDATPFNNNFMHFLYTLNESIACPLWDLGVVNIVNWAGQWLYKPSANSRAANGLTAREKTEGPGAFPGALFGDSFVPSYAWDPGYQTVDPDFAAYVSGKTNQQFSGGGYIMPKSIPAGTTRVEHGWGVLTGDVVSDVTYKNQPGSLRLNKPSETPDSGADFRMSFDGSRRLDIAINPMDNAPAGQLYAQYAYRMNSQALYYPKFFTGHWYTRPGCGLTQPAIDSHTVSTVVGFPCGSWAGYDSTYVGSRIYVDGGPNSNDPNAVGAFYTIQSVVNSSTVVLNASISKPGTKVTDGQAYQGNPDTSVNTFNLTGGTKGDIFSNNVQASAAGASLVSQWADKEICQVSPCPGGTLHYHMVYEHGGGSGGIHLSDWPNSYVGPMNPNTWYQFDKSYQFLSTKGWETFGSGATHIKRTGFDLTPYSIFGIPSYLFIPGYGERATAITGSPWAPGLYKIIAFNSSENSFTLATSPTGGVAATGGDVYIGQHPQGDGLDSWVNRHRLWMDGIAAAVSNNSHFNFATDANAQPYGINSIWFSNFQTARDCCQYIPGGDAYYWYSQVVTSRQPIPFETADESGGPVLPTATVLATDASAAEAALDPGVFTFSRTGDLTSPLTVFYAVGGTATNGGDYSTISGSVTIGSMSSSATVTITPIDDATFEGTETVTVTITSSPNYNIGSPSFATVNILDNDSAIPASAARRIRLRH